MPIKPTPEIYALIKKAAEKYQVPFELLYAQIKQESSFNPTAVSKCGARGLMQIMPPTWREITVKDADLNNYIFDPEKNLDAGCKYLKQKYLGCMRMIVNMPPAAKRDCTEDNYWRCALASYNGGWGYVLKAINICYLEMELISWANVAHFLTDHRCSVRGKTPDHKQMLDYVEKIWKDFKSLSACQLAGLPAKGIQPTPTPLQGGDSTTPPVVPVLPV